MLSQCFVISSSWTLPVLVTSQSTAFNATLATLSAAIVIGFGLRGGKGITLLWVGLPAINGLLT